MNKDTTSNSKMKIGIISINMYSKYLNFACPLHTFAFQQFLLKNGFDATVIDYKPIYFNNFDMVHPCNYYKKSIKQLKKQMPKNTKKIEDYKEKAKNGKKSIKKEKFVIINFKIL